MFENQCKGTIFMFMHEYIPVEYIQHLSFPYQDCIISKWTWWRVLKFVFCWIKQDFKIKSIGYNPKSMTSHNACKVNLYCGQGSKQYLKSMSLGHILEWTRIQTS